MKTKTLYRPIGQKELDLIKEAQFKAFPPRLEWQPIFYPVLNEEYASQIAREWNTKDEANGCVGYVTKFEVDEDYLSSYEVHQVGGKIHLEYWIPAEELATFNEHIMGEIEIIAEYRGV